MSHPHAEHPLHQHLTAEKLAAAGIDLAAHVEAGVSAGKTPEQVADDVLDAVAAALLSLAGPVGLLILPAERLVAHAIVHAVVLALARAKHTAHHAQPVPG